jgi:hypothetical protein
MPTPPGNLVEVKGQVQSSSQQVSTQQTTAKGARLLKELPE